MIRNTLHLLTIVCLTLCTCTTIHAKHIISGSMSYECLGNGDYDFTMIVYRDCSCTNCGQIDNPANIAIYEDGEPLNLHNIEVGLIEELEPAEYENCEFEGYCVERGTYKFTLNLPLRGTTYSVVYQRCCWSLSIANMRDPGEQGISVMTEITPKAQAVCNSQSLYDGQLALITCPNREVSLEIPKFDAEGDSLAVRLCLPFLGGGNNITSNDCNSIIPRGNCPPPYDEVPLVEGFDANNPFPTEDGIHLDSETNSISFVPTLLGRYVFSICITEYRDGEIISEFRSNLETQIKSNLVSTKEIPAQQNFQAFHAEA